MTVLGEKVYQERLKKIRSKMDELGVDGYVVYSNQSVNYLTGYKFIPTERPVALLITEDNIDVTVPKLEEDAAKQQELIDQVHVYYDYPGNNKGRYYNHSSKTPEKIVQRMIENRDVREIGCDMDGAPGLMGYEGPTLQETLGEEVKVESWTEKMRITKSEEEIKVLRKSAEYADQAFEQLRNLVKPGKNEVSLNLEMKKRAAETVLEDQGALNVGSEEISGFRILSGKNTYNPHGQVENRQLQEKDILLPGMALAYKGYNAELERTMFLGEPTEKQKNYFEIMLEAQKLAQKNVVAGVKLSHIDQEVHDYFKEQGVLENTRHHTGHGLGLQGHEKPFIDRGNDKKLKKNMVISLEPGIYFQDAGGFRHSDTFLVKENGVERLTRDPRDLESNILRK